MNYLAHIYLSGNNPKVQTGNFVADSIKGKDYVAYENEIKKGILLHRQIDTFTDKNPYFRLCKHLFVKEFNHYSGIITDMIFDHILAKNWANYSDIPLPRFSKNFYLDSQKLKAVFPPKAQQLIDYIAHYDWLNQYEHLNLMKILLNHIGKRIQTTKFLGEATEIYLKHQHIIDENFKLFFNEMILFVAQEKKILEIP